MEPQTQSSKDTVTMTVEIPKSARTKLGRLKGIYGCDSLACTVSSIVDDVVLSDALVKVADKERMTEGLAHNEPTDLTDDPIPTIVSPYDAEKDNMIAFCMNLMHDLEIDTVENLVAVFDDIVIENVRFAIANKPVPSNDIPEWKD